MEDRHHFESIVIWDAENESITDMMGEALAKVLLAVRSNRAHLILLQLTRKYYLDRTKAWYFQAFARLLFLKYNTDIYNDFLR